MTMNVPEMYRILFTEAVEERNVGYTERIFNECSDCDFNTKDMLEIVFKKHMMEIAKSPNLQTTQQFISYAIDIAKKSLIDAHFPANLIADIIDLVPLDMCEPYFSALVEGNIETWRDTFFEKSRTVLLRLCNNLLSRLSTVDQAIFRGQILIFLIKIIPYSDRSGSNVDKQINTDYLQVKSDSLCDKIKHITTDTTFVHFKSLQAYLRDPDECITKTHWEEFLKSITGVLKFFKENGVQEAQGSVTDSPVCGKVEFTDSFLRVSVYTTKFRRQILLQTLMVFQYLTSQVLNKEQLEAIQTNTETIHKMLENTQPDGKQFLTSIKKILQGENRWSAWKSAGCPEHRKPESRPINLTNLPKKVYFGDMCRLAKLKENAESRPESIINNCIPPEPPLPTLHSYLSKAASELRPECTTAEDKKLIYNGDFGWRALRLIAARSNRFFDYSKTPVAEKSEFLKILILKVLHTELDNAEVTDDEASDEACASTIQIPITTAEFETLFGTLGDDWKILAKRLGFSDSEIESVTVSNPTPAKRASSILRSWFEGSNNSSIEEFCTVVDSIGHAEISDTIITNYLQKDEDDEIEKNENEVEVQDTTDSLIDDDDPSASESADSDTMS